jgi:hypothetical protein
MAVTQTIWVLQWDRYTSIAKSQDAPPEFWVEYKKIALPSDGQITEYHIKQLKALMLTFKLAL